MIKLLITGWMERLSPISKNIALCAFKKPIKS